jgi:hypothetical protein
MAEVNTFAQLRISLKRMVILGGPMRPAKRIVSVEQGFDRVLRSMSKLWACDWQKRPSYFISASCTRLAQLRLDLLPDGIDHGLQALAVRETDERQTYTADGDVHKPLPLS